MVTFNLLILWIGQTLSNLSLAKILLSLTPEYLTPGNMLLTLALV